MDNVIAIHLGRFEQPSFWPPGWSPTQLANIFSKPSWKCKSLSLRIIFTASSLSLLTLQYFSWGFSLCPCCKNSWEARETLLTPGLAMYTVPARITGQPNSLLMHRGRSRSTLSSVVDPEWSYLYWHQVLVEPDPVTVRSTSFCFAAGLPEPPFLAEAGAVFWSGSGSGSYS